MLSWRRNAWNKFADVVIFVTTIFSSAHICKNLSIGRCYAPALSLITMWQQHYKSIHPVPFLFAAADELVDDNLGTIGEITELRFP